MKRVNKVNKCITGWNPYPDNVRQELLDRFGCRGENANFEIEGEYPDALVRSIGKYLSEFHGILTEYQLWYSEPIKCWRLVYGRS